MLDPLLGDQERSDSDDGEEQPLATPTTTTNGPSRLFAEASPQLTILFAGCTTLLVRLPFSLSIPHFVSTTWSSLANGDYSQARHEILLLLVWHGARLLRLIRQDVSFFDVTPSGELVSRLNNDCSTMAGDLTWFFRMSMESTVRIVGITAYMLVRSPVLGAITLTVVPVVGAINKFYGDWLRRNASQVQDALAAANSVAQEALTNVRTVISFSAENRETEGYKSRIENQYHLDLRQLFMLGLYYMVVSTFLVNTVTQGLLLWIGVQLTEHGRLRSEVLLPFMLYQGQLQNETLNLFMTYSSFLKCCGAGDKVFALMDRKPPPPAIGGDSGDNDDL